MTSLEVAGQELKGVSFHGQYLNYEVYESVRFVECDFRHVDTKLASFRASSVEAAEMRKCRLEQIDIAFTNCTGLVFDNKPCR